MSSRLIISRVCLLWCQAKVLLVWYSFLGGYRGSISRCFNYLKLRVGIIRNYNRRCEAECFERTKLLPDTIVGPSTVGVTALRAEPPLGLTKPPLWD